MAAPRHVDGHAVRQVGQEIRHGDCGWFDLRTVLLTNPGFITSPVQALEMVASALSPVE
jgi:hypothetical protein